MSSPSKPPPAPDPVKTANAQAAANRTSAITQAQLNMVDQSGPQGSTKYTQTGTYADGTPKFSVTSALSQGEQGVYDANTAARTAAATGATNTLNNWNAANSGGFNLNNDAVESRLFELGRARLDPLWQTKRANLETQLYNQGAQPGTELWNTRMRELSQGENDAYNSLLLSGRGQAVDEKLKEWGVPVQTALALGGYGTNQNQNLINTPSEQVASPDVAGMTYKSYELGPLAQWQSENQYNNALMGGLFGLGGAALGGWARGGFTMPKFG